MKIKVKKIPKTKESYLELICGKDCYLVTKKADGVSYDLCQKILELQEEIASLKGDKSNPNHDGRLY